MTQTLPKNVGRAHTGLFRRLLKDPVAVGCLSILLLIVLTAICAPLLTTHDPQVARLADTLAPMSSDHPLGGDGVGRDVLARLLYGSRTSLLGALITLAVALVIGIPSGLAAGYYRKYVDGVLSWVFSVVMAVPAIIVMLVVLGVFSSSMYVAMAVLGVIVSPGVYRLVRSSTLSVRSELYVDAAVVAGLGDGRIIARHVLPMARIPTILQCVQIIEVAIGIQAGLVFLGLGSSSQASWGAMLNDAFANLYAEPLLLLWPSLAIGLTIGSLGLLSNSIRDALGAGGRTARRRASRPVFRRPADTTSSSDDDAGTPKPLLRVDNLCVSYPTPDEEVTVVDGVSLQVQRGEILGIVGESGSGKSQTAFAVLGLTPPGALVEVDRLEFDGKSLIGLRPREMNALRGRRIAYVPQEPMSNLDPCFVIGDQLAEPLRRHLGMSRRNARARALELLDRVGIADPERVYYSYPHQISGGMAQRVLIAGAVSCEPDLLIADEPTTALDVTVQAEILELLRSLQREQDLGVVMVTHNLGVVADLCDTVAVMREGAVVEQAPVQQLFDEPAHPYTRSLLASTLDGKPARAGLHSSDGTVRSSS